MINIQARKRRLPKAIKQVEADNKVTSASSKQSTLTAHDKLRLKIYNKYNGYIPIEAIFICKESGVVLYKRRNEYAWVTKASTILPEYV